MQINFKQKPFFRSFALTSILLPVLSLYQPMAYAEQPPVNTIASSSPSSEAKEHLMAKLRKLAFFSANFSQKILSGEGEILQQGSGTLAISKPNLVNWKTITPDETLIVSDGNTLWFYDPFIEQASAYSLAKSIHNTPILLLTSDEPQLWQQYHVSEQNNAIESGLRFVVLPKDENSQIKKLTLSFEETKTKDIQLSEFSFEDATGQISQISLSHFNSTVKPDASLFTFSLPEGVRLEDKR
ncbi:outer membrane lipoprotein chaperone LolA [Colwellia sp. 12G3]|uniref:outer membrane lipoprotein chaperone LolA n=1 Tax=Colwellia sp. 12G3 TaxID=2058299 RepID=UPI000C338C8D|nr:outer membrane lipoprotein chaperone LolA [Colwellia sp. 12G3]PKI17926.1 outer membrane lipoprotein carrier protein LolA [Colwellia sp. 12G3]